MIFDFLRDILFPRVCAACGRLGIPAGAACEACLHAVALHETFFCGVCFRQLPQALVHCHRCHYILAAAGEYRDTTLKALIHALKFDGATDAAESIAWLLARYAARLTWPEPLASFLIAPIPLSRRRERMRGFNQSERIARCFGAILGVPLPDEPLIVKTKDAKPQSETADRAARRKNLWGAFEVPHPALVSGKNILLIDDVTTSGTTFREAARALKSAGARRIVSLAVAKA